MAEEVLVRIVLAVIVGVLFGIVYCMRVLVLMERRVARIEEHIDRVVHKVLQEEIRIEKAAKRR
jgi:HAMP domain-containing protein